MVRSALRSAELSWASRIAGRLDRSATGRLLNLVATSVAEHIDDSNDESASLLALIKSSPEA